MEVVEAARFDVVLVALDPTVGSEIQKTRPCVVISPDEMNQSMRTRVVAPMTTQGHLYPWRVPISFEGRSGRIALDQVRTVDQLRILKHLGNLDERTSHAALKTLSEMFAP
ncbi:MAG: growth inhibitor [Chloroflexi bacterium]|nr:growth inhibitor [Chloroflexota bacterium]